MSRIGRRPIPVPAGVTVTIDGNTIRVKGPKGELHHTVPEGISVAREDGVLQVARASDSSTHRSLHGLSRTLVDNMVVGVTQGFTKVLEITGVGYRATLSGKTLALSLGLSHPVQMPPPDGISFAVQEGRASEPYRVTIAGIDKQLVGETAARIRKLRPPEPYKGKGIKYAGEVIRRKAGKAGKVGAKKK
jgi:large subunit ribosomal protein L6